MAKGKATVFFCQDCGYESSKWMGQCPGCGGWNTFVEEVIDKSAPAKVRKEAAKAEVVKIADIKTYHIFNFNANFIIDIFAVRNIYFWKFKRYIFKVLLIGKYFHKFYKMYLQFPNI